MRRLIAIAFVAVATMSLSALDASAGHGLFHRGGGCCDAAPSCGCEAPAPVCCEAPAPSCCDAAPSCCGIVAACSRGFLASFTVSYTTEETAAMQLQAAVAKLQLQAVVAKRQHPRAVPLPLLPAAKLQLLAAVAKSLPIPAASLLVNITWPVYSASSRAG